MKLKKSFIFVIKGVLFCLLAFHLVVLVFHNLPDNPISHQFKYQIRGYMDPLFSQSWHLFSPTPANSNSRILIKYTSYRGAERDTTSWYDVTQPLIDQKSKSFWSPVQRILKSFSTATISLATAKAQAIEYIAKHDSLKANQSVADKFYKSAVYSSNGHKAIVHYAYYVFEKENDIKQFDSVFLDYKVIFAEFPRFSKRHLDYFDLKNYKYSALEENEVKIR